MRLHTKPEQLDLLIVDGNTAEYRTLALSAQKEGLQIAQARDGHEALQIASTQPARVWVANLKLRDMSGIELMALVRSKRVTTPFYLVSDTYLAEDELATRAAGATGYLSKPVNAAWLEFCRAALARQPAIPTSEGQLDGIKI